MYRTIAWKREGMTEMCWA